LFVESRTGDCTKQGREDTPLRNGFGQEKIVFGSKDGAKEMKSKLESTYPKLVQGGGFEILRTGSKNELVLISPSAAGYCLPFFRDHSGLAQALAYKRPLQSSLVVEMDSPSSLVSFLKIGKLNV